MKKIFFMSFIGLNVNLLLKCVGVEGLNPILTYSVSTPYKRKQRIKYKGLHMELSYDCT